MASPAQCLSAPAAPFSRLRSATRLGFALLLAVAAQAQSLRPLHVTANGLLADDSGKPLILRGLNRSGTGSGTADAAATDSDYAAQNKLLNMNVVRLFINAAWWNNNVSVPIANLKYQDYIDQLIQRAKKYGNYVVALKAGQFPDAPCGADGKNCPAANQGDLNCAANPSLCAAQDTTGANIDTAFAFWTSFTKKYAADPAVLYDTWEDMHGIDNDTWSSDQTELIAVIRTYNPQALIFVEDTGTAFESIVLGSLPDFGAPNLVWNFHLYNATVSGCIEPASPRYTKWPQNFAPLSTFAQANGHAVAISEWGGCNDSEPYHTDIANFAAAHDISLVYFDNTNVITVTGGNSTLSSTGSKVAQAYSALASASTATPLITLVANSQGEAPLVAPNTWVEIKGNNLAPAGSNRIWGGSDFVGGQMPTQLDGVSVKVNGKNAFVYFISPGQVNILTPPDAIQGGVTVSLANGSFTSPPQTAEAQALSPAFFTFGATTYVAAVHTSGSYVGPSSLYPGLTAPAKPGETILIYTTGFGPTSTPIVSGSVTQGGTLSPLPDVKIGGLTANVTFAGLVFPGEFQFNVVVPPNVADGDQPIVAAFGGSNTQPGTLITIQH